MPFGLSLAILAFAKLVWKSSIHRYKHDVQLFLLTELLMFCMNIDLSIMEQRNVVAKKQLIHTGRDR
uniref:Uncharacterized protein n=1 Tax=Romanomermis culicivorax TaxID=13658 RepID=A0A915I6F2_ROMCU